jgi:hypothetical protein
MPWKFTYSLLVCCRPGYLGGKEQELRARAIPRNFRSRHEVFWPNPLQHGII